MTASLPRPTLPRKALPLLPLWPLACLLAAPASAQITFTIQDGGPTIGLPDSGSGTPISEGDVLAAEAFVPLLGPLDTPRIVYSAANGPQPTLGLTPIALCGVLPCPVEVDALSYGQSLINPTTLAQRIAFSTDRFAHGNNSPFPPNINSEGPAHDLSADILIDLGLGLGPLSSIAPWTGSIAAVDGNGLRSQSGYQYPGLGLIEPTPTGVLIGDNMDGLAVRNPLITVVYPVYFSLDPSWVDPLTGQQHQASAQIHGFRPGDVIVTNGFGGAAAIYASAGQLGLDLLGAGTDDVDALIVRENGIPGYQPSLQPNDWLTGVSDLVMFSVRRGSAIIGNTDSLLGIPIEEGDLLVPPSPIIFNPVPGIYIPAEQLGLATVRSGVSTTPFGDDLNAAELLERPLLDCNANGIEDAVDVAFGFSEDVNDNGIPDECEGAAISYCHCSGNVAVCNNADPNAGCRNSTGSGALLSASGTASVTTDDLILTTSSQPLNAFGLVFMGSGVVNPVPFGDGLRCVGGPFYRFPIRNSGLLGGMVEGPGIVAWTVNHFPNAGQIQAGDSWGFQNWYRDPTGPCNQQFNLSSAMRVTFAP